MTEEQIAELEEMARMLVAAARANYSDTGMTALQPSRGTTFPERLLLALEERKRLLEALRATREALDDSVDECGSGGRSEEAWDALATSMAAIACAEEPAP